MKKLLIILAGILVAGVLFVDVSGDNFREKVSLEVRQMRNIAREVRPGSIDMAQLEGLPFPVKRYLRFAFQGSSQDITTAVIEQTGTFRAKETANWVPLQADQYAATTRPSFVWHARIRPTPYTWIDARDRYYDGTGVTEGRLMSAVPLLFSYGREMDVSSLARFLAEAPWYPSALLPSRYLTWKAIDKDSAEAVISDAGYTASVVFTFNEKGEITQATTGDRYRSINGKMEKTPWSAHYGKYQIMHGIAFPAEVEFSWDLPKSNYQYAKVQVTAIRYNEQ